jgi:hypothetical protein
MKKDWVAGNSAASFGSLALPTSWARSYNTRTCGSLRCTRSPKFLLAETSFMLETLTKMTLRSPASRYTPFRLRGVKNAQSPDRNI